MERQFTRALFIKQGKNTEMKIPAAARLG